MARAATHSDVYNAVAEPCRRAILDQLAGGERPVGDLVDAMALAQPSVSKHLRVLKEVGLVATRRAGRQRFYRLNAEAIRPMHDWVTTFERYFDRQLDRVKERAEAKHRGPDTPSR
ncbi:MAG: transcriptional regulator [Acidobacteria bacterium]|jgi:DNA-binding transcriptional ArsR family regulator|nr:transcriptional regulator [Acidobacteriota bacterium]MDP7693137.1 metalloregulator ArsR/SmtB family transcription factor [Vicinamibacterales bacterium]HJN46755.1 metalloregulator ArsR/SmtB family transcription factor [Vicinamibacterales bacterium]|tara:strand:- start:299 stop:646 length:348 start_codon:yes stop_codon:yes gene_type:complete